jgi:serine/threonine protein kinase/cytochrome c-type biogenesis protein CcmH/NrfG
MVTPAVSSTVCSICGQLLDGKEGCLACLLRVGLDEPPEGEPLLPASLVFGDFEIERCEDGSFWELGRGAMGVTYQARDKVLHRRVALKVIELPAEPADARAARERFLREARAAAALRHANVASVFQFGASAESDRCYYAMELVEGETLEALVRRDGPLPVKSALEIAIQITRALVAAAAHGLVHRDLKPANIMLAPNESNAAGLEAKVIDFGLAKATAEALNETDLTHGAFVGTPTYASPEQLTGQAADARSDIYSLGVTLWYALTGEVPRSGKTLEEIRSVKSEAALPVAQLVARKVPARVIKLLRRTLAADPAKRPQSARALLGALELCQAAMEAAPRRRRVVALFGLLAIGVISLTSYLRHRQSVAAALPPEKSIAVLPFENLSKDEANAFFAAGIQDDVLTSLAQIHELKVISRASVKAYQPGARDMRGIGQTLGVANVLEGSVRRSGDRVVVNVQLVDTRTDRPLWASHYDNTLADSIGLQGELASEIAVALRAKLAPEEKALLETRPTENPQAYALYLRARGREAAVNGTIKDFAVAAQLYQQAIALDPKFALAYARFSIASSYLDLAPSSNPEARAAADEAVRLSPSSGEAHLALGLCLYTADRDYGAASKELSRALATSPNEPEVLRWVAFCYRQQGRWPEVLATLQRAVELDPRNLEVLLVAADNHLMVRDWTGAAARYQRALLLAPDSANATISLAYIPVLENGSLSVARKLLHDLPHDIDPDGIATEARWDIAMLGRDYGTAEKILVDSPVQDFPRLGEGTKDFFEGRTARARGDFPSAQRHFAAAAPHFEARVRDHPGAASGHADLGQLYAYMQRDEEAIREGRRAVALEPENRYPYVGAQRAATLALIYALLDKADEAIPIIAHLLRTPAAFGWSNTPESITLGELRLRWEWDPLRKDPRFQKILAGPEPKTSLASVAWAATP